MKLHSTHIAHAKTARSAEALIPLFQKALQIEHATIPPYLTALYSLRRGTNSEIHSVIQSVVIEEMLHVTICANIINALGGSPSLTHPGFIPEYPSHLPMGIGDHLVVGLEPFSKDLMNRVFMVIEMPDQPLGDGEEWHHRGDDENHHTLGFFYHLLQKGISELPEDTLPGKPEHQTYGEVFGDDLLFPILTKADAIRAIDIIIDQGEGSVWSPLDSQKDMAHYYRFAEIYHGKKLVADPHSPDGYSYSGAEIPFDEAGVIPLFPSNSLGTMDFKSESYHYAEIFANLYKQLLVNLENVFNGNPGELISTLNEMRAIHQAAHNLMNIPMDGHPGYYTGPVFVN